MPGRTGKRARPPKPCAGCGKKVEGDFMRHRSKDYHQWCWFKMRAATALDEHDRKLYEQHAQKPEDV